MLITGFEPFTTGQGVILSHNPTAGIAERVASLASGVRSATLPVSYAETPRVLERLFTESRPRVWIGLGFAPHRTTLDLEVFALNMAHARRGDNDGASPWLEPIVPGGPEAYRTRLNPLATCELFGRHGVEMVPAFHAGTFLCNQVFYLGCHRCETGRLELAAFIHVPPMEDSTALEAGLVELFESLTERYSIGEGSLDGSISGPR
jgi:pyroglutamyl-peptidase